MIKQYSLNVLTDAVNRVLHLDPDFHEKCIPLDGKVIEIILLPLRTNFYLTFINDRILFVAHPPNPPDTSIESSPIGLIRLSLLPASKTRSLFHDGIKIRGDLRVGEQVKKLFDDLDLDWETHLANLTGDVAAYHIGACIKKISRSFHHARQSMQTNMTEYLQEEMTLLPPQEAIDNFFHDIHTLADDVARMEARIQRLQKKS